MSKPCSKCREVKDYKYFDRNNSSKSGYSSRCKICRKDDSKDSDVAEADRLRKREWYLNNRERTLQEQRQSRQDDPAKYKEIDAAKYLCNRSKILSRVSEYQKKNPDVNREAGKRYRKRTPELQAQKTAKRRARKLKATPAWYRDEFDEFYVSEIYALAQMRSASTGFLWHVDHIVPLTSDIVCGLHCASNLQLLTALDNVKKLNRHWPDMWENKEEIHD